MPTPQQLALQKFMSSPGVQARQEEYQSPSFADRMSGVDDLVPSADSAEVHALQQTPEYGSYSRNQIRESGLAKVRQLLKMKQMEDESAQNLAHTKGQYDVQASEAGAQAAMDRVLAQQQGQTARTELQQGGMNTRSAAEIAAEQAAATQKATSGRQKMLAGGAGKIQAQRAALQKDIAKGDPTGIAKLLRRQNPRAGELNDFDAAYEVALKMARGDYEPEMGIDEVLALENRGNATPEDKARIMSFLTMLQGQ